MADLILRNGFDVVTRSNVVDDLELAMGELDPIRPMMRAIERLAEHDGTVAEIAKHVRGIIDGVHNDLDVLRERAEKAGVIGEMVAEGIIPRR